VYLGRFWEKRSGCNHPQWWCILFDGGVGGVMMTHPQRCNRLWVGRGLKVWNGHRHKDLSELLEGSDMSKWKMKPSRGF
jgi:hypothetical protein